MAERIETPVRRGRGRLVAFVVVPLAVAVLGSCGVVALLGRVGDEIDARGTPPPTALFYRRTTTRPATTTTTLPPEATGLRGRPPSPVEMDEAACVTPLKAGALVPQDWRFWAADDRVAPTGMVTDEQARIEISQIMRRRFRRADPERAVTEALALYDSPALGYITGGEVSLRAALAELKGSIGEPGLMMLLSTKRRVGIAFGNLFHGDASGEAWNQGTVMQITVRAEYRLERPAVIAPVLFHELLHDDEPGWFPEELINNVLDSRQAVEMLRDSPEGFAGRTALTQAIRWAALAQLNTRVGAALSINTSDGRVIFPDSTSEAWSTIAAEVRSLTVYRDLPLDPSPGSPTLVGVLQSMAPDADVPADSGFDDRTVSFLEAHAGLSPCDQLVAAQVAGVLRRGSTGARLAQGYVGSLTS